MSPGGWAELLGGVELAQLLLGELAQTVVALCTTLKRSFQDIFRASCRWSSPRMGTRWVGMSSRTSPVIPGRRAWPPWRGWRVVHLAGCRWRSCSPCRSRSSRSSHLQVAIDEDGRGRRGAGGLVRSDSTRGVRAVGQGVRGRGGGAPRRILARGLAGSRQPQESLTRAGMGQQVRAVGAGRIPAAPSRTRPRLTHRAGAGRTKRLAWRPRSCRRRAGGQAASVAKSVSLYLVRPTHDRPRASLGNAPQPGAPPRSHRLVAGDARKRAERMYDES